MDEEEKTTMQTQSYDNSIIRTSRQHQGDGRLDILGGKGGTTFSMLLGELLNGLEALGLGGDAFKQVLDHVVYNRIQTATAIIIIIIDIETKKKSVRVSCVCVLCGGA